MRSIAQWNPARSVWETTETLICGHSDVFSETWPRSGMTRGGRLYELPTSAPLMVGSVCSSSPGLPTPRAARGASGTETMYSLGGERSNEDRPQGQVLLPTPVASDWADPPSPKRADERAQESTRGVKLSEHLLRTPTAQLAVNGGSQHPDKRKAGGHGPTLADEVEHLLPTPRATDGTKGGPNQRGSSGDLMLPSAVQLLPTPAVNDMGAGKTVDAWDAWTAKMKAAHGNGNGHGPSLSIEALRLLPTPRSQNGEERNQNIWERPLDQPQNLENALARLPGAPTPPPSRGGNESSDDPPPHPPSPA